MLVNVAGEFNDPKQLAALPLPAVYSKVIFDVKLVIVYYDYYETPAIPPKYDLKGELEYILDYIYVFNIIFESHKRSTD